MKRNDLTEIKNMDIKALAIKSKALEKELADLILDRSDKQKQSKDIKMVFKKRKDLAQVLTILRQKQLLEQIESEVK